MTHLNNIEQETLFSKSWQLKKIPFKKQIHKLKIDLLKLQKESAYRDKRINEILQCSLNDKSESKNEEFRNNMCHAELIVSHIKTKNAENTLIEKTIENETFEETIKLLKKDKNALQEIIAKQKVSIDLLKEEIIDFRKLHDHNDNLIRNYLENINKLENENENLSSQIKMLNLKYEHINNDLEKAEESSLKSKGNLEDIVTCISDGEENIEVDAAIQKIKYILNENETIKSQLTFYEKQSNSFDCEQQISRETINRLSTEVEIEKSKRIECLGKLSKITEKLLANTKHESYIKDHINCLGNQISELRDVLSLSMQDNLDKSNTIAKLENQNKFAMPLSECIENMESFIVKAEDILAKNKNGKDKSADAMFLIQCIRKLNVILKSSNTD